MEQLKGGTPRPRSGGETKPEKGKSRRNNEGDTAGYLSREADNTLIATLIRTRSPGYCSRELVRGSIAKEEGERGGLREIETFGRMKEKSRQLTQLRQGKGIKHRGGKIRNRKNP